MASIIWLSSVRSVARTNTTTPSVEEAKPLKTKAITKEGGGPTAGGRRRDLSCSRVGFYTYIEGKS
ncbi:MAG TPA: hypothetical protein VES39_02580, partial [Rhodospirillales bacterium]|nr:hypothetical protein [Rhodospirillales bacterium]